MLGLMTCTRQSLPPGFNKVFNLRRTSLGSCAATNRSETMIRSNDCVLNPWLPKSSLRARGLNSIRELQSFRCSCAVFNETSDGLEKTYWSFGGSSSLCGDIDARIDEVDFSVEMPNSRTERSGLECAIILTSFSLLAMQVKQTSA